MTPAPAPATAAEPAAPAGPPETLQDCETCPVLVRLPNGTLMARDLVTRADFAAFAAKKPIKEKGCYNDNGKSWFKNEKATWKNPGFKQTDRDPVVCVSWDDANNYADWLSEKTGKSYRLPTFEESQAAAAAGATSAYWWGEEAGDLCTRLNAADASYKRVTPGTTKTVPDCNDTFPNTSPVGSFPPNAWGLNDMAGNVWQWTNSCVKGDCSNAVFRGGGWNDADPGTFKIASSFGDRVVVRSFALGFRLVRDPD